MAVEGAPLRRVRHVGRLAVRGRADAEASSRRYGESGRRLGRVRRRVAGRYDPQMETVRSGARPWTNLDVLHREALDGVLEQFGLDAVTPTTATA